MGLLIASFIVGVIVGLLIGPDSEREQSARVDGWLEGHAFAKARAALTRSKQQ